MPPRKNQGETDLDEAREWFRSSDDVRSGYISGVVFGPKPVEYSVIDGLAIFEGDIVLGSVADLEARPEMDFSELPISGDIAQGVVVVPDRFRWPRCEIPYEIHSSITNPQLVRDAIAHWEQNTTMRFPLRTAANAAQFPNLRSVLPRRWLLVARRHAGRATGHFVRRWLRIRSGRSRNRARGRTLARTKPRGPRPKHPHQLGEYRSRPGAQFQPAHYRR